MLRSWRIIPAVVFLGIMALFMTRLDEDPHVLLPVLRDQPLPVFTAPPLPGREEPLRSEDLRGFVSLLNVFGSWCVACAAEHAMLMRIKAEGLVMLNGLNWREKTPEDGRKWLEKHGDPYDSVGLDPDSQIAISLGVTGAPETFIVDAEGIIRYKHIGPIDEEIWVKTLRPLIQDLKK